MARPGQQLEDLVRSAHSHLVLVAPFAKAPVLARLLEALDRDAMLEVFTRWRADEVVAGVSDLGVWDILAARGKSTLWLCSNLHGKVYSSEERTLVGSANLTQAALGWSASPNLEVLVPSVVDNPEVVRFMADLRELSVRATEDLRNEIQRIADALALVSPQLVMPKPVAEESLSAPEPGIPVPGRWIPQLQEPDGLWPAYQGDLDDLTSVGRRAASADLAALDMPHGLTEAEFRLLVGGLLLQTPAVVAIDGLVLTGPQRFGAVVDLIQASAGLARDSATHTWQGLMRWLLFFLPERYGRRVDHHTEMFFRIPSAPSRTGVWQTRA